MASLHVLEACLEGQVTRVTRGGVLTDVVIHIIQYIKSMDPVNLLLVGHLFFIVACMSAMSFYALNVLSAYFVCFYFRLLQLLL